jgi:GNAT superfamily N-acetyltransferase
MKFAKLIEQSDRIPEVIALYEGVWPAFIAENPSPHTGRILTDLAAFQLVATDSGQLQAAGNTVPVYLPADGPPCPTGWDDAIDMAMTQLDEQTAPNTLVALAIGIAPAFRRKGISSQMIAAMKRIAREQGFERLIAPVHPTMKSRYPITPMSRYARWKRSDGESFDPWLRVHARCGAVIKDICPTSMTIRGTVVDWERWTGLAFPESGRYVVERALNPVQIDVETDEGVYVEENVWVEYLL